VCEFFTITAYIKYNNSQNNKQLFACDPHTGTGIKSIMPGMSSHPDRHFNTYPKGNPFMFLLQRIGVFCEITGLQNKRHFTCTDDQTTLQQWRFAA
jgi:hypothetical protein